ncbi:MAG: hypothetical protein KGY54_12340 [Oleiphilaceae bacterium]|nr:hypothetical protein [Oleiphilaceae bacterium]
MSIIQDVVESMQQLPEAHQREVLALAQDLRRHAEEQKGRQDSPAWHNPADAPDPEILDREVALGHS